jgi:hypothetical protein
MKEYIKGSLIEFGKHKGKTIGQVMLEKPDYIFWCCIHLDHFYISVGQLKGMLLDSPVLQISDEVINALEVKRDKLIKQNDFDYGQGDDGREFQTYNEYTGYYAQDWEDYSDQDIDDIFDGDPDNYWNID